MAKILVVEDDKSVSSVICDCLSFDQHIVEAVYDGWAAQSLLRESSFDLMVLDISLPGLSGLELCRELRSQGSSMGVLMLTGRDEILQKEEGLNAGADDYLTKPFHVKELLARVRALLRRVPHKVVSGELRVGDVVLDPVTHTVTRAGSVVLIAHMEFRLLEFLMRHKGTVFSADALLTRIWPSGSETSPDAIRTYIKRLRQKLDADGEESILRTIPKVGYAICEPGSADPSM